MFTSRASEIQMVCAVSCCACACSSMVISLLQSSSQALWWNCRSRSRPSSLAKMVARSASLSGSSWCRTDRWTGNGKTIGFACFQFFTDSSGAYYCPTFHESPGFMAMGFERNVLLAHASAVYRWGFWLWSQQTDHDMRPVNFIIIILYVFQFASVLPLHWHRWNIFSGGNADIHQNSIRQMTKGIINTEYRPSLHAGRGTESRFPRISVLLHPGDIFGIEPASLHQVHIFSKLKLLLQNYSPFPFI